MIGIDLSLTGTAYAFIGAQSGAIKTTSLDTRKMTGRARRDFIADAIFNLPGSVFCIEGLAMMSQTGKALERAAVWYRVVDDMERDGCRVIVVSPPALKKFVTGSGKGEKSTMVREVYRRWGFEARTDDEADAVGLLQVGRAVIGELTDLTKPQLEVVAALRKQKQAA